MKAIHFTQLEALSGGNFCPLTNPWQYLFCNSCSPGTMLVELINGGLVNYINEPTSILAPRACPD
jgi:hypothetical protein